MNKDELKLHIELVPQSLWYLNPRTAMGRKAIYAWVYELVVGNQAAYSCSQSES